jgi:hypothetical protein
MLIFVPNKHPTQEKNGPTLMARTEQILKNGGQHGRDHEVQDCDR